MAALDDLPPDQRAVLQLVLQRGRSYDEIAQLLSIDRGAVRQRALDAFDALTPATALPGPEQALVTDYLLGQLPERVAAQVYSFLQASEADRAWAEAMVGVVGPLVQHPLPEIPVGAPLGADDWSSGGLERHSDSAGAGEAPAVDSGEALAVDSGAELESGAEIEPNAEIEPPPSSRRGGAILLGVVAALIAAAIVIAVANSGSGAGNQTAANTHTGTGSQASTTRTTRTTATTGTASTAGTTTASSPQIIAQLNLKSPTGATSTVGIVDVVRVKGILGMVIDAQGVPANTSHNAYAVWLYNSPTSHRRVGFVPNLVGKNEQLVTDGRLPAWAARYHHILISLETQPHPASPGEVVLYGPFHE